MNDRLMDEAVRSRDDQDAAIRAHGGPSLRAEIETLKAARDAAIANEQTSRVEANNLRQKCRVMSDALEAARIESHQGFDESGSHYSDSCPLCQKIDNALKLFKDHDYTEITSVDKSD